MKTRMTMIAAVVVTIFAGGQMAFAAGQMHEDEWDKVNLYGDTTIANDSAYDWGPWKELIQPAAGPGDGAPGIAWLGAMGSPFYRPLAHVTETGQVTQTGQVTPEGGCPAGAACGYAVYWNFNEGHYPILMGLEGYSGPYPASMVIAPEFEKTGDIRFFGWDIGDRGDLAASYSIALMSTPLSGGDPAPMFTDSGPLEGTYRYYELGYGVGAASRGFDGVTGAKIEGETPDGPGLFNYLPVAVGGDMQWVKDYYVRTGRYSGYWVYRPDYDYGFKIYQESQNVPPGPAGTALMVYIGGENREGVRGMYVAGFPTGPEGMAAMNTLIAHYQGNEVLSNANVNLTVNFNAATWNGSWSGGGLPNWGASGSVNGANILSSEVHQGFQTPTTGLVQGTFYGSQAQALAGISDVQLSSGRHVDLFVTGLKDAVSVGAER